MVGRSAARAAPAAAIVIARAIPSFFMSTPPLAEPHAGRRCPSATPAPLRPRPLTDSRDNGCPSQAGRIPLSRLDLPQARRYEVEPQSQHQEINEFSRRCDAVCPTSTRIISDEVSGATRHKQTIILPSYCLSSGCCKLITDDALGAAKYPPLDCRNSLAVAAIAAGAETPPPMNIFAGSLLPGLCYTLATKWRPRVKKFLSDINCDTNRRELERTMAMTAERVAQSRGGAHTIAIVTATDVDGAASPVYQAVKATIMTPIFARKAAGAIRRRRKRNNERFAG